MKSSRRRFLTTGAAGAALALGRPIRAADTITRVGGPRLKLGLAAYSFRDFLTGQKPPAMDLSDFIDRSAKMQVDGVELTSYYFPEEISQEYLGRLRRQCHLLGLGIIGCPIRNSFTFPAGPAREENLAHVRTWIDRCGDLGAPTMRIFTGDLQSGQTLEEAQRHCVETIEACADQAARRGVLLGLENHPGPVSGLDSVLTIVKAVRSDFVGINLDTGYLSPDDPYADFERCLPWAVTVQIKTEVRATGEEMRPVDYSRIVDALKRRGFRGYATLEYEGEEDPLTAVPRELDRLRALL